MRKAIVGLYEKHEDADRAVQALRDAGFVSDDFSLVTHETLREEHVGPGGPQRGLSAGMGAVGGATVGALAGLLTGVGALLIPGIGPVLAVGTLATALATTAAGAAVGAAAGSLMGALVSMGIPHTDAEVYCEGVKRGGILINVWAEDEKAEIASSILKNSGAVDVESRREQWREMGWTGFREEDEQGKPIVPVVPMAGWLHGEGQMQQGYVPRPPESPEEAAREEARKR